MKIELKTLSYVLVASGEGEGIIDQDSVFDEFGIPYIPSKRIKGILRDSALEITQMFGLGESLVNKLFGKQGEKHAKIHISNLYIKNYEHIKKELKVLKQDDKYKNILHPQKVKTSFSDTRYHTAIDEDTQTAKKNTLRVFRVLKENLEFEGDIETESLEDQEKALLYLSVLHTKYMGMSRHNGYGKIELKIKGMEDMSLNKAIELLSASNTLEFQETVQDIPDTIKLSNEEDILEFEITLLEPAVLSRRSDQSTVGTIEYIPGSTVRGVLSKAFKKNINHYMEKIYVSNAYLEGLKPLPFFIQEDKNANILSVFKDYDTTKTIADAKPMYGFFKIDNGSLYIAKPEYVFYFHHNLKKDIYYYQALKEGQKFRGYIVSDKAILEHIKNTFERKSIYIGKSKTTQYGMASIHFSTKSHEINIPTSNTFVIYATSQIVVYNEFGYPSLNIEDLRRYLEEAFDTKITIKNAVCRQTEIKRYIDVWKSKSMRLLAYDIGSCFLVSLESLKKNRLKEVLTKGIGELTHIGYGRIDIFEDYQNIPPIKKIESKPQVATEPTYSKTILWNTIKENLISFVKFKGFEEGGKFHKHISNSLVGRLRMTIEKAQNQEDISAFLKDVKDKKAGRALKDVDLYEDLENFTKSLKDFIRKFDYYDILERHFNKELTEEFYFYLAKIYWLNYLSMLRIRNQKN